MAIKIAALEVGDDRPPIKVDTLTTDVSTIKRTIIRETKMKMPLEPRGPWI